MTATPNAPEAASDDLGPDGSGGDPACWAHRVCQPCGRLNAEARPVVCEACGAAFPDADE